MAIKVFLLAILVLNRRVLRHNRLHLIHALDNAVEFQIRHVSKVFVGFGEYLVRIHHYLLGYIAHLHVVHGLHDVTVIILLLVIAVRVGVARVTNIRTDKRVLIRLAFL